jgi:hypothetical protein
MDQSLYEAWQASGKSSHAFLETVPPFDNQSSRRSRPPQWSRPERWPWIAAISTSRPSVPAGTHRAGRLGLLRHLLSGLWKLTTAAAIPYYTGQYGESRRGFGFVTIGANVDDFHRAATESAKRIGLTIAERDETFQAQRRPA